MFANILCLLFLLGHFIGLARKVDLRVLELTELRNSITFYDSEDNFITKMGDLQIKIKFADIPKSIINALLATEDVHFWSHFGLNVGAMIAAVGENIAKRKIVRGGSTITQQLVKNFIFVQDKSFMYRKTDRKIVEMLLSIRLETELSKEKILEYYLNHIYFGKGAYGIAAAAEVYFNKTLSQLTIEETAFLIGLVRAPSMYAADFNKAIDRCMHVLRRMHAVGFIDKTCTRSELLQKIKPVQSKLGFSCYHFIEWVISTIPKEILSNHKQISVYTTINSSLQAKTISKIPNIKSKSRFTFDQYSFIACELDGAIRVMIGGMNDKISTFNRAIYSLRQSGSVFKIYTYLTGLLKGWKITDTISDSAPTINNWTPSNYMHAERGFVTIKFAFLHSVNGAAVNLALASGLDNIINTARLLGITSSIPRDWSIVLGSASISLYQLMHTLLIIANDGHQKVPYGICEIRDAKNQVIWTYSHDPALIIDNSTAMENMKELMYGVVEEGTGRYAKSNRYSIGGKTGTSQDYRDIWFCAFSPFLVTCAWFGNDDNSPMQKHTKPGLVNPAVALCKEVIEEESKEYEEVEE